MKELLLCIHKYSPLHFALLFPSPTTRWQYWLWHLVRLTDHDVVVEVVFHSLLCGSLHLLATIPTCLTMRSDYSNNG